MGYVELALAIIGEVIGTNFMKASDGFIIEIIIMTYILIFSLEFIISLARYFAI